MLVYGTDTHGKRSVAECFPAGRRDDQSGRPNMPTWKHVGSQYSKVSAYRYGQRCVRIQSELDSFRDSIMCIIQRRSCTCRRCTRVNLPGSNYKFLVFSPHAVHCGTIPSCEHFFSCFMYMLNLPVRRQYSVNTNSFGLSNAIPCTGQNIKSLCGVCWWVCECVCAKRAGDRGLVTMEHE